MCLKSLKSLFSGRAADEASRAQAEANTQAERAATAQTQLAESTAQFQTEQLANQREAVAAAREATVLPADSQAATDAQASRQRRLSQTRGVASTILGGANDNSQSGAGTARRLLGA